MKAGKLLAAVAAGLIASLAIAASASADTVQVTTNLDTLGGGDGCTLRDAAAAMELGNGVDDCDFVSAAGTDSITFAPSLNGQNIALDSGNGEVTLNDPRGALLIAGPGMEKLTVTAGSNSRVMAEPGTNDITISGMTITGGDPDPVSDGIRGGCIFNAGTMTLQNVRVTDCTASAAGTTNLFVDGAAIGNDGTLAVNNSLIDDNHTSATNTGANGGVAQARGAIYSDLFATGLTITNSTISGNDATANDDGTGNAIAAAGVSTFSGFDVMNSTVSGNSASATEAGGDATSVGGILTQGSGSIELSTIADNTADLSGSAVTLPAGGVLAQSASASVALRSSTIAANGPTTGSFGGANLIADESASTTVGNTIIANPRGGDINCLVIRSAVQASAGYNDDYSNPGGPSCFDSPQTGDVTVDPLLSGVGLADNDAAIQTIALQPISPMIDAGKNDTHSFEDERGFTRPVDFSGITNAVGGDGSDIGAYELQQACPEQTTPTTPSTVCPTPPGPTPTQPATPPSSQPKKKKCKKHKKGKKASAAKKKCKKRKK